jgi:pilus assembly protein Flp/PilA
MKIGVPGHCGAAKRTKNTMQTIIAGLLAAEHGVTAIEYGLIAALVAVVCIVAWSLLGTSLSTTFNNIGTSV